MSTNKIAAVGATALAGLSSLTVVPAASAQTAASSSNTTCSAVDVVIAVGTGGGNSKDDPNNIHGLTLGRNYVSDIEKAYGEKVSAWQVPYTASVGVAGSLGETRADQTLPYGASRLQGTLAAQKHIEEMKKLCPSTKYVITGFSQGATVAGDVTANLAAGKIPGVTKDDLLASYLIADPGRAALTKNSGSSSTGATGNLTENGALLIPLDQGLPVAKNVGLTGPRTSGAFSNVEGKVLTFCHNNDVACSTDPEGILREVGQKMNEWTTPSDNQLNAGRGLQGVDALDLLTSGKGKLAALTELPPFIKAVLAGDTATMNTLVDKMAGNKKLTAEQKTAVHALREELAVVTEAVNHYEGVVPKYQGNDLSGPTSGLAKTLLSIITLGTNDSKQVKNLIPYILNMMPHHLSYFQDSEKGPWTVGGKTVDNWIYDDMDKRIEAYLEQAAHTAPTTQKPPAPTTSAPVSSTSKPTTPSTSSTPTTQKPPAPSTSVPKSTSSSPTTSNKPSTTAKPSPSPTSKAPTQNPPTTKPVVPSTSAPVTSVPKPSTPNSGTTTTSHPAPNRVKVASPNTGESAWDTVTGTRHSVSELKGLAQTVKNGAKHTIKGSSAVDTQIKNLGTLSAGDTTPYVPGNLVSRLSIGNLIVPNGSTIVPADFYTGVKSAAPVKQDVRVLDPATFKAMKDVTVNRITSAPAGTNAVTPTTLPRIEVTPGTFSGTVLLAIDTYAANGSAQNITTEYVRVTWDKTAKTATFGKLTPGKTTTPNGGDVDPDKNTTTTTANSKPTPTVNASTSAEPTVESPVIDTPDSSESIDDNQESSVTDIPDSSEPSDDNSESPDSSEPTVDDQESSTPDTPSTDKDIPDSTASESTLPVAPDEEDNPDESSTDSAKGAQMPSNPDAAENANNIASPIIDKREDPSVSVDEVTEAAKEQPGTTEKKSILANTGVQALAPVALGSFAALVAGGAALFASRRRNS